MSTNIPLFPYDYNTYVYVYIFTYIPKKSD